MIKLLYLEDEPMIQEVTSEYLKMQDYDVTLVGHGDEAIELLKKNAYDLAVLDIIVPGASGLDVLFFIQEHQLNMKVIILSALGDEQTQLKAFNAFADDYIVKPFSPLLLIKRIEAVLRRGTQLVNNELGLVIDEKSYQAFYNQEVLPLTLTEFLILQKLSSSPTQVFTRENILDFIFADDHYANDRVVDAHVKNLRKKLPINCIKTVMGVGYRYETKNETGE